MVIPLGAQVRCYRPHPNRPLRRRHRQCRGAERDALAGTQPVRQLERGVADRFSERNPIVRERPTPRHVHSEGAGQKGLLPT
jgi:hypothetical protein